MRWNAANEVQPPHPPTLKSALSSLFIVHPAVKTLSVDLFFPVTIEQGVASQFDCRCQCHAHRPQYHSQSVSPWPVIGESQNGKRRE